MGSVGTSSKHHFSSSPEFLRIWEIRQGIADGSQNFAFITDRSIVERKDLYEDPQCKAELVTHLPLSHSTERALHMKLVMRGPPRESFAHKRTQFIFPRFTTQKSHLTQRSKEVKRDQECLGEKLLWKKISSLRKPESGDRPCPLANTRVGVGA